MTDIVVTHVGVEVLYTPTAVEVDAVFTHLGLEALYTPNIARVDAAFTHLGLEVLYSELLIPAVLARREMISITYT